MSQLVTLDYLDLLERIYQDIAPIDEEAYGSDTIRPLCGQIDYLVRDFWFRRYKEALTPELSKNRTTVLLWGTPPISEKTGMLLTWPEEIITKKLLCYAESVAIPDWTSDVLEFTSQFMPGTWHTIFKNLKRSIGLLLQVRRFAEEGSASIFPGYDYCRAEWQDVYPEFEKNSQAMLRKHNNIFEARLAEVGVKKARTVVKLNMVQEALFVQNRLGFFPATGDAAFFAVGSEYLRIEGGSSRVSVWAENYRYVAQASNELIAEIRRWGNQALFIEHLHAISTMFDLSDTSLPNRDKIARYLRDAAEERRRHHVRTKSTVDLLIGVASLLISPLSFLQIAQSARDLIWPKMPKKVETQAADWACMIKL